MSTDIKELQSIIALMKDECNLHHAEMMEKDASLLKLFKKNVQLEAEFERLKESLDEVVKISDRKHAAWDRAKKLLKTIK